MDIGSRFGNGQIGSRLVYKERVDSVGKFIHEMANVSTEKATMDLMNRFGENTRRLIKNFTGGNLLDNLGSNVRMR
jgi:hypothetical protein